MVVGSAGLEPTESEAFRESARGEACTQLKNEEARVAHTPLGPVECSQVAEETGDGDHGLGRLDLFGVIFSALCL